MIAPNGRPKIQKSYQIRNLPVPGQYLFAAATLCKCLASAEPTPSDLQLFHICLRTLSYDCLSAPLVGATQGGVQGLTPRTN